MKRNKKIVTFLLLCSACIGIFSFCKLNSIDEERYGAKLGLANVLKNLISGYGDSQCLKEIDKKDYPFDIKTDKKIIDASLQENRMPVDKIQLPLIESIQENNYFCVPACLQMVLRYKGIEKSQMELSKEMNTKPITGTEYIDLARVANKYLFNNESVGPNDVGYHIQTLNRYDTNPEIASIFEKRVRLDISSNDPVFVAIDFNALYPNLSTANHVIVITGYALYSGTNNIAYYYYIDPSYAVQDNLQSGLKTVTKEQLMNAIVVNEEPAYIW